MSRPRKPFGASQPGRLPSTMMKVLAAEMSDPQRLRRGKQYAKDGSVTDIVIEAGTVVCEIQGSRSVPYIATLEVRPGDGMPLRRDVNGHCTCPDSENLWGTASGGSDVCKHVVAAMFTLADELLLEPELLDVWRGYEPGAPAPDERPRDGDEEPPTDAADERPARRPSEHPALTRRHLRLVGGTDHETQPEMDEVEPAPEPDPPADPLESLLVVPSGASLPLIDQIERIEPAVPRRRELAEVLRDALANLRIEWD